MKKSAWFPKTPHYLLSHCGTIVSASYVTYSVKKLLLFLGSLSAPKKGGKEKKSASFPHTPHYPLSRCGSIVFASCVRDSVKQLLKKKIQGHEW